MGLAIRNNMYSTNCLEILNTHQKQSLVYDYHMTIKSSIAIILTLLCLLYVPSQHHILDSGEQGSTWSPLQDTAHFWSLSSSWQFEGQIRTSTGNLSPTGSYMISLSSHLDQRTPVVQGNFSLVELHKTGLPEWS